MKKYRSLFKMKIVGGLQYRAAAWASVVTQFAWGIMKILMFQAFYHANPQAFPMSLASLTSYIWLQQAFLALYMIWFWENDIFESLQNGEIAYELVRPVSIYNMWFVRSIGSRISKTFLRSLPILLVVVLLPKSFRLHAPQNIESFLLFLFTMMMGLLVIVSMNMIIYFLSFYTIHPLGIRMVFQSLGDILMGAIIPLPFFPKLIENIVNILPFAAVQNVPFRIYSGDLYGESRMLAIFLQFFWLVVLVLIGKSLERKVVQKVVLQGG